VTSEVSSCTKFQIFRGYYTCSICFILTTSVNCSLQNKKDLIRHRALFEDVNTPLRWPANEHVGAAAMLRRGGSIEVACEHS